MKTESKTTKSKKKDKDKDKALHTPSPRSKRSNNMSWSELLCRPSVAVKRMLVVGVGVAAAQQTTGIESVQYYILFILKVLFRMLHPVYL
jgi:hypothetical protein